jgi:hypothetical protein
MSVCAASVVCPVAVYVYKYEILGHFGFCKLFLGHFSICCNLLVDTGLKFERNHILQPKF